MKWVPINMILIDTHFKILRPMDSTSLPSICNIYMKFFSNNLLLSSVKLSFNILIYFFL